MLKTLVRMQLSSFLHAMFKNQSRSGKGVKIVFALLMLYAYGCIAFLMGMLFDSLLDPFMQSGIMWFYYGMAGILAFALSFIYSIFMASSMLYQAKDNALLLSLPIPSWVILTCRISVIWLSNLFSSALVLLPAGIVHWMSEAPDVQGILRFAAGFLTLPFLCTALSSLVGYLVMRLTSRMRRKNLFTMIFSLAFLALYFGAYSQAGKYVQQLIAHSGQIAQAIQKAVFPAYCFGMGLSTGGLDLLWWILCALIPFVLVFALLRRSFIRLCTHTGNVVKKKFDRHKAFKTSSLANALTMKELRRLSSSSAYMLNGCMGALMSIAFPIVFLFKPDLFDMVYALIGNIADILPGICAFMLCFSSITIMLSSPSVSLEGKSYWLTRSLPIPTWHILAAKVRLHLIIAVPSSLIGSILFCIALRPDLYAAAVLLLLPQALNLFVAYSGVCINLRFPRLDWSNEVMVIKQGMAVSLTMLLGYILLIAMAVLYFALLQSWPIEHYMLLWTGIFLLLTLCLHLDLKKNGVKRYEDLG